MAVKRRRSRKQTKPHGLLPVCCPWPCPGCPWGRRGAFGLLMHHETPGDPRVRALPSPAKQVFACLALSWRTLPIPCLADSTLDGTETGHIRDAETGGGGRGGGHLPPADGHMQLPEPRSLAGRRSRVKSECPGSRDAEPTRTNPFVLEARTAAACFRALHAGPRQRAKGAVCLGVRRRPAEDGGVGAPPPAGRDERRLVERIRRGFLGCGGRQAGATGCWSAAPSIRPARDSDCRSRRERPSYGGRALLKILDILHCDQARLAENAGEGIHRWSLRRRQVASLNDCPQADLKRRST
jgi:hypothetical protein